MSGQSFQRTLKIRSMALMISGLCILLASLATLGVIAYRLAAPGLMDSLQRNALLVGGKMQRQIDQALRVGIPFNRLVGVRESFQAELARYPELAFIALRDKQGRIVELAAQATYQEQASAWRAGARAGMWSGEVVLHEGGRGEAIVIGVSSDYFNHFLRDSLLELCASVAVAVVLTTELMRLPLTHRAFGALMRLEWLVRGLALGKLQRRSGVRLSQQGLGVPTALLLDAQLDALAARAAQLASAGGARADQIAAWCEKYRIGQAVKPANRRMAIVRLAIFFMALSEELSRPFFAVFASGLATKSPISPDLLAVLPIGAFMLAWAFAQPLGPAIVPRLGIARGLLLSAVLAGGGLALTAGASDPLLLCAYRIITGLGYGLFLIIAQAAVISEGHVESRARDLAQIAAGIVAAGICGPMLGGVLADRFGFASAFSGCALCAVAGGIIGSLGQRSSRPIADRHFSWKAVFALMRAKRFMRLILLSAIPAKFAATAILVVLLPLHLHQNGYSKTLIGQVLMLYFLVFVLVAPIAAGWSDARGSARQQVVFGGLGSGLAIFLVGAVPGAWAAALGCALFGACQALISGPQLAWATAVVKRDRPEMGVEAGLGVFRLLERMGSVISPLACGVLLAARGSAQTLLWLALAMVVSSAGLALAERNAKEI